MQVIWNRWMVAVASGCLAIFAAGCGGTQEKTDAGPLPDEGLDKCIIDNSQPGDTVSPDWKLEPGGTAKSDWICPRNDTDYYWFTIDAPKTIVTVNLSTNTDRSPVDLCYDIFKAGGTRVGGLCDSDGMDGVTELVGTHYLKDAGTYTLQVHDDVGDDEDSRKFNNYLLGITTRPDPDSYEANNTAAEAKAVTASQGFISFLGDQDWFKIDSPAAGQMLLLDLTTTSTSKVDLLYRVYRADKTTLVNEGGDTNGMDQKTALHDVLALPAPETYYIQIVDAQDDDSDLDVGYTLALALELNPDARDQAAPFNNGWQSATPINNAESATQTITGGYLASRADTDWYKVLAPGVTDTNPAVIEIELQLSSSSVVTPAIDLIVPDPVPDADCTDSTDCSVLAQWSCGGCGIDCSNAQCPSHECDIHKDGKCRATGECMDAGAYKGCGIRSLVAYGADWGVGGDPRHLLIVAPMYGSAYYLYVRDFGTTAYDKQNAYTLKVTVRPEKDTHESPSPNGLYLPYITGDQEDETRNWNKRLASDVACTDAGSEITCSVTGYLSFRGDQDWYKFTLNGSGTIVDKVAESNPATMGANVDYDINIEWDFHGNPAMPIGIAAMFGGQQMGPEVSSQMAGGHDTWGDGANQSECSYLCGEYQTPSGLYLWVFTRDFKKYDYDNPYTITIHIIKGSCPSNCGYCQAGWTNYPCPNPLNPNPGGG